MKPASLRPQAKHDLAAQSEHYAREGGVNLGGDFLAVALAALAQAEAMPGIASPRIGSAVGMRGLRSWHLSKYPCSGCLSNAPTIWTCCVCWPTGRTSKIFFAPQLARSCGASRRVDPSPKPQAPSPKPQAPSPARMSQVLINQFLAELDRLKKIGGTQRESVVSEAFKDRKR